MNLLKKLKSSLGISVKKDIDYYLNCSYKMYPFSEAMGIALKYGIVGSLWILLSDELLSRIFINIDTYKKVSTYKGWMYVAVTMFIIYSLVFKKLDLFKKALERVSKNFEELNASNEELIALEEELRHQFEELEIHRNALSISEQRYAIAVDGADCGIWDWDVENNICYFSPKWKSYLGFDDDEVENTIDAWTNLLHPDEKDDIISKVKNYTSSKSGTYENVYRMRCKNGEYKWILSKGSAVRDKYGRVVRVAGSHSDITEYKLIEGRLNKLAYYDMLTELPNRFLFEERVNDLINMKIDQNKKFALVYMDIDNFKHINDTLGHSSGDLLLKYVSEILKDQVKDPNLAARLGGDEFAIIFEGINDSRDVINKLQDLLKYLRKPWILDKQEYFISFSIGIAMYPEHGDDLSSLLKNSDIAMYFVKKDMKNNYCFYSSEMQEKSLEQVKMVSDLRRAIDNEEFVLYYQPIMELREDKLIGVEALIRWIHPIKGLISPMEFIPIAEETGLIFDIGKWVLKTALMQKKQWDEQGYSHIKMSINISGKRVAHSGFINEIRELISQTKIKCDEIQLEVTETALMEDLDASMKILKEIKNMGIKIALDDFGTGYSSLTYLKKLPIDVVKLDRDFIKSISDIGEDEFIIEYVIKLTHELKLRVVAEGIETKEQLSVLKLNNCDYGQGYLFNKPVSKEEIEKLLQNT